MNDSWQKIKGRPVHARKLSTSGLSDKQLVMTNRADGKALQYMKARGRKARVTRDCIIKGRR